MELTQKKLIKKKLSLLFQLMNLSDTCCDVRLYSDCVHLITVSSGNNSETGRILNDRKCQEAKRWTNWDM